MQASVSITAALVLTTPQPVTIETTPIIVVIAVAVSRANGTSIRIVWVFANSHGTGAGVQARPRPTLVTLRGISPMPASTTSSTVVLSPDTTTRQGQAMTDLHADHADHSQFGADSVTAISCNRCGGTLDIAERTNFTTCGFCGTRLRVERSATSLSTVELDELRTRTDDLERNVSVLRDNQQIEQLDRQWEARRAELSISNGKHEPRLPTLHGTLLRLLSALVPMVFFFSGQFDGFGTSVLPVLGVMTLVGLLQGGSELHKYLQYRAANTAYWSERARLLAER